jgi:hypothetical protein
MMSPGYAAAAGSRLIAGRDVTWAETYSHTPVALISESLAREWWRDPRAAIGKRIRTTLDDDWRGSDRSTRKYARRRRRSESARHLVLAAVADELGRPRLCDP